MKILHVISSLKLENGGVAQGVINLTSYYSELGVEATVLSFDDASTHLMGVKHLNVITLGKGMGGAFSYHPKLIPWLKEHATGFDAVIVDGLWQYHGYAVYKALDAVSVPYYVFTHGMLDPWFKHTYPLKHIKKYGYWFLAQYPVLKNAKAVLFTCEEERLLARQSFKPYSVREKVVGYGTTITSEAKTSCAEDFYVLYPELREKRIFLFLSRIHEKKGCDLLLKAFSKVADQDPTLHLVMAGPDQTGWQARLVELAVSLGIADRITWTGMLKGQAKWGALRAAEVFVLPSHQENFGIVVAEALAVGTPVLISNKVNIWREIEGMNAGLIEDDDLTGSKNLLFRWLNLSLEERSVMQENAIRCFKEKFDMQQAAINLISLIKGDFK